MADISINDITDGTINGSGAFDKMMASMLVHLNEQFKQHRLKGPEISATLIGVMPAVLSQATQFALQEKVTEADIEIKLKELEIKDAQLALTNRQTAQIEDQIRLAELARIDSELTTVKQRLAIDKDVEYKNEQIDLLQTQNLAEIYKKDNILPAELAQLQTQTDVAKRGMVEQELTGIKQRALLDTEKEAKQYEVNNLLPEQLIKIQEEIDLLQSQDSELIANGTKDRYIKDAQLALTNRQTSEIEQSITLKANEDTRAQIQLDDSLLGTVLQRNSVERDIVNKEKQLEVSEAQRLEIVDATTRANVQLNDSLLSNAAQRAQNERQTAQIEKSIEIAEVDKTVKEYERDNLLPKQLEKADKDIEATSASIVQTARQVAKLEKDIEISEQQRLESIQNVLMKEQQVESAKAEVQKLSRQTAQIEKEIEQIAANTILIQQKHVGRKQ